MTDADYPLTPEERARFDAETEPLVRLVADLAEHTLDPRRPSASRFYAWLARDLLAREHPDERLTPAQLERVRERVEAFVHADRLRIGSGGRAPSVREPEAPAATAALAAPGLPAWGVLGAQSGAPWLELGVAAGVGREIWDEPCERWVDVPEGVPPGRYVVLTVRGDSMTPLFHSGDAILVRMWPKLERGTVVVARHPDDGYVVKEVGRIGRREVELRSLNREYAPMTIPRAAELVLGTVVMRWGVHCEPDRLRTVG
ncbi:MAG: S24 family peptidase [Gemmatimonadaceae bacterium]